MKIVWKNNTIKMTVAQAGGWKGTANVNHILMLKELIIYANNAKNVRYIAFLDVTKAYHKAWLDDIMYVMYKDGLKGKCGTH